MKKIVILLAVSFSFLLSSCIFLDWPMEPGPHGHGHSEYHHSEHGGGSRYGGGRR